MRLVVSDRLDPAAAAVQSAHGAALAADVVSHGKTRRQWDETVLVAHSGSPSVLGDLIVSVGGAPWASGAAGGLVWFTEPDLLWEPTVIVDFGGDGARLGSLDLFAGAPGVCRGRFASRALLDLRRMADRSCVSGEEVWAAASRLGDPASSEVRARAVHLLCRGREPP